MKNVCTPFIVLFNSQSRTFNDGRISPKENEAKANAFADELVALGVGVTVLRGNDIIRVNPSQNQS